MPKAPRPAPPVLPVLVASGRSADRARSIACLLLDAAQRSGWAERLDVRVGGFDAGAGLAGEASRRALAAVGITAAGTHGVADLAEHAALFDGVACIVCDTADTADDLLDWDEAGQAQFVVLDEVEGREASPDDEDALAPSLAEQVAADASCIEEVLRRVVTYPPSSGRLRDDDLDLEDDEEDDED